MAHTLANKLELDYDYNLIRAHCDSFGFAKSRFSVFPENFPADLQSHV